MVEYKLNDTNISQYPNMCYIDKNQKMTCGLNIPKTELKSMIELIDKTEKVKPGFIKFIRDNNVSVYKGSDLLYPNYYGDEYSGKHVRGYEECEKKPYVIAYSAYVQPYTQQTVLLHEWAHCKEGIEMRKKGLPLLTELEKTQSGNGKGWRAIGRKIVPVAPYEKRAESFVERMKKQIWKIGG